MHDIKIVTYMFKIHLKRMSVQWYKLYTTGQLRHLFNEIPSGWITFLPFRIFNCLVLALMLVILYGFPSCRPFLFSFFYCFLGNLVTCVLTRILVLHLDMHFRFYSIDICFLTVYVWVICQLVYLSMFYISAISVELGINFLRFFESF